MLWLVDADLEFALRLAETADVITLDRFRAADLRVTRKPDRTPVTDADVAAEDAVRAAVGTERPGDVVLGEERGGGVAAAGRTWVIDPIDGTKNFSRGSPVWATLIALAVDGEPVLGVASAPALGRRWWAARGTGAWTTDVAGGAPRRITVSGVRELADAYLSTTDIRTFAERGRLADYLRLLDACWETRAFGDFWQHCLVAEGVLDLAVDAAASAWDLAALLPIVTEAGGAFTDLAGRPTFAGGDGLSSNGAVHAAALAIVGRPQVVAELAFEDFTPGRVFDLGATVVDRDEMVAFARRFDPQPFHLDEDAAAASIFRGLAASGWFTAALWMRAYADGVLARATSLGSPGGEEIAWPAPVFAGDELRASMEVLAARLSRSRPGVGLVTLRATTHRGDDLVFRSTFTGMFGTRA